MYFSSVLHPFYMKWIPKRQLVTHVQQFLKSENMLQPTIMEFELQLVVQHPNFAVHTFLNI